MSEHDNHCAMLYAYYRWEMAGYNFSSLPYSTWYGWYMHHGLRRA